MAALTEVEIASLLDPDLVVGISGSLTANLAPGAVTVDAVRALDKRLAVVPPESGAAISIPRGDGTPLGLRLHEPSRLDPQFARAVVLWIHGGGMFLGSARQEDAAAQELSEDLGVRTVSVDYRLAPEHPYPEPLNDCYLALERVSSRFDHVFVVGASAGGGLAAALALLARDRSGPGIAGLHLYYPMLDDRATTSQIRLANTGVWNERLNRLGWSAYLDGAEADAYAAPARATDLGGLPPTYLDTGELDMFLDEDVAFAEGIRDAGGQVELFVTPAALHAYEAIAPEATISRATVMRRRASLRAMMVAADSSTDRGGIRA